MLPRANRWTPWCSAAAFGVAAWLGTARAYIIESSAWPMGTATAPTVVTMQLQLQSGGPANRALSDGSTSWNQVAQAALADWNQYLVTMQYGWVTDSTVPVSSTESSNGFNNVRWSSSIYGEDWGSAVGITVRFYTITGTIYPTGEADVIFDSNFSWDSYRGPVQSVGDLRRVAIHEFGHVLGLDHPDDYGQTVTAIMNRSVSGTYDLATDDLAGGQYLYNPIPSIITQPVSQAVAPGATVTLAVGTTNNNAATYQWYFNNSLISGATATSYTLTNVQAANVGSYKVAVTDRAGTVTSNVATLAVAAAPVITTNPVSQAISTGGALTLSAAATGSNLTYQWMLNGTAISGATGSSYSVATAGATDAGAYTLVVSNGSTSTTSAVATVTITTNARLINLSTSANAGIGSNVLAAGFVIGGTGSKSMLIRGVGPSLATFGVAGVLPDPQLTLYNGTTIIAQAGAWGGSSTLANAFTAVGAFAFSSPTSADSALLATLGVQSTSAQVGSITSNQGVALIEVYDADNNLAAPARLTNLSVRAASSAGAGLLTAGFVIQGSTSLTVLIRGDGPALATFGVTGYLPNPTLTVKNQKDGSIVAGNTGWANSASLAAVFSRVFAFPFTNGSADSAVVVTLPPGSYSASVVNADGSSGVGLVELYEVR